VSRDVVVRSLDGNEGGLEGSEKGGAVEARARGDGIGGERREE